MKFKNIFVIAMFALVGLSIEAPLKAESAIQEDNAYCLLIDSDGNYDCGDLAVVVETAFGIPQTTALDLCYDGLITVTFVTTTSVQIVVAGRNEEVRIVPTCPC